MAEAVSRIIVIPPKVPSRGYASPYREEKTAAHTTKGGKGKVARAMAKRTR